MRVNIYTLFDRKENGKPLLVGMCGQNGNVQIVPLWMPKLGIKVYEIWENESKILKLVKKVLENGGEIATSDFKRHLSAFKDLQNVSGVFYDTFLPEEHANDLDSGKEVITKRLGEMSKIELSLWQSVAADAARVYQKLEDRGVHSGMLMQRPIWSQRTYTGRSKTSGFNLQGTTAEDHITNPTGSPADVQLHFDWRAADIRVAAYLSKDVKLDAISATGDPYQVMSDEIGGVDRADCKIALLSAINAMDVHNPILDMFSALKEWIQKCDRELSSGRYLESMLGRRFYPDDEVKKRAPFNAVMQGSIAHAMQLSITQIWEALGSDLLAEIHDSVVVTCKNDPQTVKDVVTTVVNIMKTPFLSVGIDWVFPVKVSVGSRWRKWKEYKVYY